MPAPFLYRAEYLGPRRNTPEEAVIDGAAIEAVLKEHAPMLLPADLRPITVPPGAEALRRKDPG